MNGDVEVLTRAFERLVACERDFHRAIARRVNLGETDLAALYLISSDGEMPLKILASRLRVSASGTTAVLDRLESSNLVARIADPSDRRYLTVRLLPRGAALVERTRSIHARVLSVLPLTASGRERVTAILDELAVGVSAAAGAVGSLPPAPAEQDD